MKGGLILTYWYAVGQMVNNQTPMGYYLQCCRFRTYDENQKDSSAK